jgi:hypothetical protein
MPRDSFVDLFYGYPVELIMDWCCVSYDTAVSLKKGQKPSRRVLKLFELHRDGRVLGPEWDGWGVRKDVLCDPEGRETTQSQLRAYPIIWQLAREYGRQNSTADATITRLASYQRKPTAEKPAHPAPARQRSRRIAGRG